VRRKCKKKLWNGSCFGEIKNIFLRVAVAGCFLMGKISCIFVAKKNVDEVENRTE
jgi:hypothetical protein